MASKGWGKFLEIASAAVSAPIGIANGVRTYVSEGDFQKGVDNVIDPVMKVGGEFGDQHHDSLNKIALAAASGAAGGVAKAAVQKKHGE